MKPQRMVSSGYIIPGGPATAIYSPKKLGLLLTKNPQVLPKLSMKERAIQISLAKSPPPCRQTGRLDIPMELSLSGCSSREWKKHAPDSMKYDMPYSHDITMYRGENPDFSQHSIEIFPVSIELFHTIHHGVGSKPPYARGELLRFLVALPAIVLVVAAVGFLFCDLAVDTSWWHPGDFHGKKHGE